MHAPDVATVFRPAFLPELTVIHGHYRAQRFPRHIHEEYVIGVNEGGVHRFQCRGATHYVPKGAIALLNPGDVHTGEPVGDETWNYWGFYPSDALLGELLDEGLETRAEPSIGFNLPAIVDGELADRLVSAARAIASNADPLQASSALIESLTDLLIRHADHVPSRLEARRGLVRADIAKTARDYIHAHALTAITLRELADAARAGPFALLRAFRQAYGIPPYEYVVALRIGHAKRLLASGCGVAATAHACGFVDQSHLHRHFRRLVGATPGAYARAASG